MHGFQQGLQFPQHVHHHSEAASIQPVSQVFGHFDSRFGDAVQHQLAYSHHRYGAQHLPPQQLYYANPWQLQPYPTPPSGHIQFTGESQGIYMCVQKKNSFSCTLLLPMKSWLHNDVVLEFGEMFYMVSFSSRGVLIVATNGIP